MKKTKSFICDGFSLRYGLLLMIVLCFLSPLLMFKVCGYQFVFNTTSSLNGYVFVMKPFDQGKRRVICKGDIIVFVHPLYPEQQLLKKVTHLGGETYAVDENSILRESTQPINQEKSVPQNHVAVIGDHQRSYDSRYETFGFIPLKDIRGQAWKIV